MSLTVLGKLQQLVFNKDKSWDHFYSMHLTTSNFFSWERQIFEIMLMTLNIIYACTKDLVIDKVEKHDSKVGKNLMKLNGEKCNFMLCGKNSNEDRVNIGQALIKESTEEMLL